MKKLVSKLNAFVKKTIISLFSVAIAFLIVFANLNANTYAKEKVYPPDLFSEQLQKIKKGTVNKEEAKELIDKYAGGGLMSNVFALHLINNGIEGDKWKKDNLTKLILSKKYDKIGFALTDKQNDFDFDVNAMTLQALAPQYESKSEVKKAVDEILKYISDNQNSQGGFSYYNVDNCESCAQVAIALCCLKINPLTDNRFIKNKYDVFKSIERFRIQGTDQYKHTLEGEENKVATKQAKEAYEALELFKKGKTLFIFDSNKQTNNNSFKDGKVFAFSELIDKKGILENYKDTGNIGPFSENPIVTKNQSIDVTNKVEKENANTPGNNIKKEIEQKGIKEEEYQKQVKSLNTTTYGSEKTVKKVQGNGSSGGGANYGVDNDEEGTGKYRVKISVTSRADNPDNPVEGRAFSHTYIFYADGGTLWDLLSSRGLADGYESDAMSGVYITTINGISEKYLEDGSGMTYWSLYVGGASSNVFVDKIKINKNLNVKFKEDIYLW